jgi:hypothetical protein
MRFAEVIKEAAVAVDCPNNGEPTRSGKQMRAPPCTSPGHLWDSLEAITSELTGETGRRVIAAGTDGRDGGSSFTWNQVREDTQFSNVSVFGLTSWRKALRNTAPATDRLEFPFYQVCGTTGGVITTTIPKLVEHDLLRFVAIVRARYILEFPGPEMQAMVRTRSTSASTTRTRSFEPPAPPITSRVRRNWKISSSPPAPLVPQTKLWKRGRDAS